MWFDVFLDKVLVYKTNGESDLTVHMVRIIGYVAFEIHISSNCNSCQHWKCAKFQLILRNEG